MSIIHIRTEGQNMLFDGERIYTFMRELNRDGQPRQYGEPTMRLKDLARITEISYKTLWGIANTGENGGVRKTPPNVEQAIRIAGALGQNVNDFFCRTEGIGTDPAGGPRQNQNTL